MGPESRDPDRAEIARVAAALAARLAMEQSLGVAFMPRAPVLEVPSSAATPASRPSPPIPSPPGSSPPAKAVSSAVLDVPEGHTGDPERIAALEPTRTEALVCTQCGLCEGRTHVVFGEGSLDTDLVFVGEAPGRDEDEQGRPFVGRAGQLLTRMIQGGLKRPRASVYICNVLKCRPPGNRDPKPDEVAACTPYLSEQLAIIQPKVIVALGRIAANFLTQQSLSMEELHGRWWEYSGVPLRAIYHPSYLLRQRNNEGRGNPADRKTLEDLKAITQRLQEIRSH